MPRPAVKNGRRRAVVAAVALLFGSGVFMAPLNAWAADAEAGGDSSTGTSTKPAGKILRTKYNCVHVLKLEETMELYRSILGFDLVGADVLRGPGIEGMLVMRMRAGSCNVYLSLPAPEYLDTVGPIGNTNHNHFMLLVDDIVPIGDRLKKAGYALENEAYARDKYTFFTGPNGEIIGLTEYE